MDDFDDPPENVALDVARRYARGGRVRYDGGGAVAPPEERGFLLPIMRQGDQLSPAVPGAIHEPWEAIKRLMSKDYGYRPGSGEAGPIQDAATIASTVAMPSMTRTTGAFPATPRAAVPPPPPVAEWPVGAAIKVRDQVFPGVTHFDALVKSVPGAAERDLFGDELMAAFEKHHGQELFDADGFVTNLGRYVDRQEAAKLAQAKLNNPRIGNGIFMGGLDAVQYERQLAKHEGRPVADEAVPPEIPGLGWLRGWIKGSGGK